MAENFARSIVQRDFKPEELLSQTHGAEERRPASSFEMTIKPPDFLFRCAFPLPLLQSIELF